MVRLLSVIFLVVPRFVIIMGVMCCNQVDSTGKNEYVSECTQFKENDSSADSSGELKAHVLEQALVARRSVLDDPSIIVKKPNIITIVDYSIRACNKRVFVIDLEKHKILMITYTAHGRRSGSSKEADYFSNKPRSNASSLGLMLTTDKYFGKKGCSLRLKGLEKGINDNLEKRSVVIHAADYVSEGRAIKKIGMGRSKGCIVVPKNKLKEFVDITKGGSFIYGYYPSKEYKLKSKMIDGSESLSKEYKILKEKYHLH